VRTRTPNSIKIKKKKRGREGKKKRSLRFTASLDHNFKYFALHLKTSSLRRHVVFPAPTYPSATDSSPILRSTAAPGRCRAGPSPSRCLLWFFGGEGAQSDANPLLLARTARGCKSCSTRAGRGGSSVHRPRHAHPLHLFIYGQLKDRV